MGHQVEADGVPTSLFLNSIPKSGTNFLLQILLGIPELSHEPDDIFFDSYDYQESFYRLGKVAKHHIAIGHIYYSGEWSRMIRRLQMKQVFVIRDLRDVLVSLCHFVVEKPQFHTMIELREHFLTTALTQKERLLTLIQGFHDGGFQYPNFREWVTPFIGWTGDANTHVVTYESLIVNAESRQRALTDLVLYLWNGDVDSGTMGSIVERMEANIDPSTCGTFRHGVIGDWRTHFDEEVETAFNQMAGSALKDFGYEESS